MMLNYKYQNISTCDECKEYIEIGDAYIDEWGKTYYELKMSEVLELDGQMIFCSVKCYEIKERRI
jgi:hypothetical protein